MNVAALLIAPLLAQAAAPAAAPTLDDDRLRLCIERAAGDSTTVLAEADRWLAEAGGAARSKPWQCLGHVYTVLARWPAAEQAFLAAAASAAADDMARPPRLYAQAGNAALAAGGAERALAHFDAALARSSALAPQERGEIALDRARALVAAGRPGEAREALTMAQREAPDLALVWLLSATLSRRENDLSAAQRQIEVAASLAPKDPEVGLEAGVIAMLLGQEAAARRSWESVGLTAPGSRAALTARDYLAQLGEGQPAAVGR